MSENLVLFQQFAKKGDKVKLNSTTNCVVYTRVSSKEQMENMSLDVQLKGCDAYVQKYGYTVLSYFGGTYESAQTDERKEFTRMINFCKNQKSKVSFIIVYSLERFSRTGDNAIWLSRQLRDLGITILSVCQPIDTQTPAGVLQQNILFLFSQYDNDLRRQKTIDGMREMLMNGEWCCSVPTGYDIVKRDGKRMLVVNEKGQLLRRAFEWKAEPNMSTEEIIRRLKTRGLKISSQRLSVIFRNPFYCGMLSHKLLDGKVIKGKHECLISEELFFKVNGVLSQNKQGYTANPLNADVPLKRFLICDECGQYLRAYKSTKIQKWYYKCNTRGCSCNIRVEKLHSLFYETLCRISMTATPGTAKLIAKQMLVVYKDLNKENEEAFAMLNRNIADLKQKIERTEQRFMDEEIDRDLFFRYRTKYQEEIKQTEEQLALLGKKVSNPEKCITDAIDFVPKLASVWDSGDYDEKQQLQFLIFPEGIRYNRKNGECRTTRINEFFVQVSSLPKVSGDKKTGNGEVFSLVPCLVASSRIELESKV